MKKYKLYGAYKSKEKAQIKIFENVELIRLIFRMVLSLNNLA